MGSRRKRTLYRLTFADEDMDGLEVTARAPTMDGLMSLAGAAATAADGKTSMADVRAMLRDFAGYLTEWNREDEDGNPVPATYEGLASEEQSFVMKVIKAYTDAVSVAPPLPGGSGDGGNTPDPLESGIPMTPAG
jgi:hypothetical protein